MTHPRLPAAILRSLVADDRGQDIIEYALLFSLIALAAIAPSRRRRAASPASSRP